MNHKIPVQYVSACVDSSGYGSAARNYISALIDRKDEIDLTVKVVSFEQERTQHALLEKIAPYVDRQITPKIQIIHLTPENYPALARPDCYNIAYTTWETDRLPGHWINFCNLVDEIWVPSQWNVDVFRNSGVEKPFLKLWHGIELPDLNNVPDTDLGLPDDTFLFYFIGQWIERKGIFQLLKAYLSEFTNREKVGLVLKTHRINYSTQEQDLIKQQIKAVKEATNLGDLPTIYFYGNLMSSEEIKALHHRGHCFVLPARAEGFGLAHLEAMSYGKPVIATNYGGNLEFMNEENSYLCSCQETPVFGMWMKHYTSNMLWSEPNVMDIKRYMRLAFEDRELNKKIGKKARATAAKFSWETIGNIMVNRLKEIAGSM